MVPFVLAEIVTIGDELTRGEIVDTNAAFLAARVTELGSYSVGWLSSCRDVHAEIADTLARAAGRARVVLCSGGLGPTEDDLTVDVAAELAKVEPVVHEEAAERMKRRFERGKFALTPNNMRQVRVPRGAHVFVNPHGLAPGFEIVLGQAHCFFMPGVPREMMPMLETQILPRIAELAAGTPRLLRRMWRVFGLGESHIDHKLKGMLAEVDPDAGKPDHGSTLHFNVSFPECLVKVIVRDTTDAGAAERMARVDRAVRERLGEFVYGEGGGPQDGLPWVVGKALRDASATVALAESCTGGLTGHLLTEAEGASDYFRLGVVTYANEEKIARLGVKETTLREHGAVSAECVAEMAEGVRKLAGTTYGVAISGVAGPGGGSPEKPVGTVHLAISAAAGVRGKLLTYPGTRTQVRTLSAYWAMRMLYDAATNATRPL